MATKDCIVLLYTTGLYCLLSSEVNPPSWIILKKKKKREKYIKYILLKEAMYVQNDEYIKYILLKEAMYVQNDEYIK